MAKLTPEDREEVVKLARVPGANYTEIARRFGVTPQLVWNYAHGVYRRYPKPEPPEPEPQPVHEGQKEEGLVPEGGEEEEEPKPEEEGKIWKEEGDTVKLLEEVLRNSRLKPEQVEEVLEWARDSPTGTLNPYELNQLLTRMDGVSPRTSALLAMKYNNKLLKMAQERKAGLIDMPLIRGEVMQPEYSPWFASVFGLSATAKKKMKVEGEDEDEEDDDLTKMARRLRKAEQEGMITAAFRRGMQAGEPSSQAVVEMQDFVYGTDGEIKLDKKGEPLTKTTKMPANMMQMMQPSMNPQMMSMMMKLSDAIEKMNQQQIVSSIDKLGQDLKSIVKEKGEEGKDSGWGILIPHLLDEVKEARQAASEGKNVFSQLEDIGKGLKGLQEAGFFGAQQKKEPTAGDEIGKALKAAGVPDLSKAASKWIEKGGLDKALGSGGREAGGKFENIECAHCGNVMQVPVGVARVKCSRCGEVLDLTQPSPQQAQERPGERLMAKVKCGECGHEFTTIFRPEVPCPKCKKINVLKKPEEEAPQA